MELEIKPIEFIRFLREERTLFGSEVAILQLIQRQYGSVFTRQLKRIFDRFDTRSEFYIP